MPVVFHCFRAKARVAAFRLRPAGAIPAKTGSWNTGVDLRQPHMVRRELLIATSTYFTCGLLLQTGVQCSTAENTRACEEIHSLLADAPEVVPAIRRMSETLDVSLPATSSRCYLKFSIRPWRTARYFGASWNTTTMPMQSYSYSAVMLKRSQLK